MDRQGTVTRILHSANIPTSTPQAPLLAARTAEAPQGGGGKARQAETLPTSGNIDATGKGGKPAQRRAGFRARQAARQAYCSVAEGLWLLRTVLTACPPNAVKKKKVTKLKIKTI